VHVIATAGHVDHGKSTLVRALTGMEPDRWAEERRRGMTIDLGYAWTALPSGATVAFVDVPGHQRFLGNMLAGVGPVPAAMIVVAADEGWRRQSVEHVAALAALGVSHGLLVISRADLADPSAARQQALTELARTPLAGLEAVAVSAVTGAGLDDLRAALDRLVAGLPAPDEHAPVRLWVDRAFTMRGSGTVVTGTLPAGSVAVGDELQLVPGDRLVRIRGVQSLGEPHDRMTAVARVALNLRGIERDAVSRGSALVTRDAWIQTSMIDVRATSPDGEQSNELPASLVLHVGSAAVAVRIRPLSPGTLRLRLDRPLPLRPGDRGLLRDPGRHAVAAGVEVLDVDPPELRGSGAARRRAGDLAEPLDPVTEVRRRVATSRAELDRLGILPDGEPLPAGLHERAGLVVADLDWQTWTTELLEVVTAAADELAGGLSEAEAARRVGLPDPALVRPLAQAAGLVTEQGRVRPRGAQVQLPEPAMRLLGRWQQRWKEEPFAAPEGVELTAAGLDARHLAAAERAGLIIRLRDGIILSPDAPDEAVRRLAALPQPFTASLARTALGTTRRVAIPLLEHLDAQRRTRRGEDMARTVIG
jgi:selenocysteine-specific elongation factor